MPALPPRLRHEILTGDCLDVLPTLAEGSFDAVVTDPPYGLEFMGKEWDRLWDDRKEKRNKPEGYVGSDGVLRKKTGVMSQNVSAVTYRGGKAAEEFHRGWATAALRVLKPGGYLLAFGGTRTYHRLACAIEDAGFEVRDCLLWLYGTGFPKGKGCLKPAYEPIVLARKPGPRVLPLGVDECRIPAADGVPNFQRFHVGDGIEPGAHNPSKRTGELTTAGRWPANVTHDGSDEVLEAFAAFGPASFNKAGAFGKDKNDTGSVYAGGEGIPRNGRDVFGYGDTGTAARFFWSPKASRKERDAGLEGMPDTIARRYGEQGQGPLPQQTPRVERPQKNHHPTVKPLALMRWLVRLVCPPRRGLPRPLPRLGYDDAGLPRRGEVVRRYRAGGGLRRHRAGQARGAADTAQGSAPRLSQQGEGQEGQRVRGRVKGSRPYPLPRESSPMSEQLPPMNREAWLTAVAKEVEPLFGPLLRAPYRVTCGWPSIHGLGARSRRVGECHALESSRGKVHELFISPVLETPLEVAGTLCHELAHVAAGVKAGHGREFVAVCRHVGLTKGKATQAMPGTLLEEHLKRLLGKLPPYPHQAIVPALRKKAGAGGVVSLRCSSTWVEGCPCKVTMSRLLLEIVGPPVCACGSVFAVTKKE